MEFVGNLTRWYSIHKRDLPWRGSRNPYMIWICEVIFQQTRINQGIEYYKKFVERFPTVQALSKAEESEVLKYWEGLGYYSRARNLHFSAQYIVNELKGEFPTHYEDLKKLKGVGDYTASAIASICFDEKIPAIDGNALRVYARVFNSFLNIAEPSTAKVFNEKIKNYIPDNSGEFNQAIMELGALICTPKNPKCYECPIQNQCLAFLNHTVEQLPVKVKKIKITKEDLKYLLAYNEEGFWIQKRTGKGIWRNLYELIDIKEKNGYRIQSTTQHKLTHKELTLHFYSHKLEKEKEFLNIRKRDQHLIFVSYTEWEQYAFPKPIKEFLLTFVASKKSEKKQIV